MPVTIDQWRRAMLASDLDEEAKPVALAWSFHGNPATGALELPEREDELEELTDRLMPQALAWLDANGYTGEGRA